MVDHVLRLKLALLASAFRGGPRRVLGAMVLAVFLGGVGAAILVGATVVDVSSEGQRASLIVIGAVLSIGIVAAPLAAGLGSAMEPRRFAAFPVPPRRLALALGVAGAVGVPGAMSVVLAVALETAWAGTEWGALAIPAGVLAAMAMIIVSLMLVAVAAQTAVSPAAMKAVQSGARFVVALSLLSAGTTGIVAQRGVDDAVLVDLARLLANTPFGMLWAVPEGPSAAASARLLGGVILVAVLVVGWGWMVTRLLEVTQRTSGSVSETTEIDLGWFDLLPASPSGVVAGRSLLYWTRDPRYRAVILGLPVAPFLMIIVLLIAGVPLPLLWLIPLPFIALFLGWFAHNDVAYDHTAVWVHVAAPMRGAADRWGRVVPPLLLGVPLILITAPLFAYWSGVPSGFEALAGVSLGLLLTGLGISSVSSALRPYPAARPGAGPFDQPPVAGSAAGWAQSLALLFTLGFMAPTLVVTWWGFTEDPRWLPIAGLAGVLTGVGMLIVGIIVGGQVFRRRAPELLGMAMRT